MCGRSFLDGSARWSQLYSAALDPGVPAQQSPAKLIKKPIALHYRDFLFFFFTLSFLLLRLALGLAGCFAPSTFDSPHQPYSLLTVTQLLHP